MSALLAGGHLSAGRDELAGGRTQKAALSVVAFRCGSEAAYLITKHGFFQLNLKRITIFLTEENAGALKCYERAGYQQEGIFRGAVFLNGQYRNVVAMGQLKGEFQSRAEYEPK